MHRTPNTNLGLRSCTSNAIRCRNRSPDERCEEQMEDSEKQQRTSIFYNNTEGSLEQYKEFKLKQEGGISKIKNEKKHSPGYSSMNLYKQYFKPIHPYFSLPHLLAQSSVVNIL